MSTDCVIGLDIGGTSVKAGVLTLDGGWLAGSTRAFDDDTPLRFAETARGMLRELTGSGDFRPVAIGVCAPGMAAADRRSVASLPNRMPGMEGLDWETFLEAGLPAPVLNDAQAALLGESWQGAARGHRNILLLTLGTGVGGAAMVDGRLLRGHSGRAGHVGHISLNPDGPPDICDTPGSLELAVGNATVAERTGGRFSTTHHLVSAYRDGDGEAARFWLATVQALAAGIVSLANVLDPGIVVIGGGIATAGKALFDPLQERVRAMEWKIPGHALEVVPATLGDKAGTYGAAHFALTFSDITTP